MQQQTGWTTRRLSVAAVLGAAAVIAGGLVFVAKFGGDRGPGDNPFMAFAFGLFVIGMVVFCAVADRADRHGRQRDRRDARMGPGRAGGVRPAGARLAAVPRRRRRLRDSRRAVAAAHRRLHRRVEVAAAARGGSARADQLVGGRVVVAQDAGVPGDPLAPPHRRTCAHRATSTRSPARAARSEARKTTLPPRRRRRRRGARRGARRRTRPAASPPRRAGAAARAGR